MRLKSIEYMEREKGDRDRENLNFGLWTTGVGLVKGVGCGVGKGYVAP